MGYELPPMAETLVDICGVKGMVALVRRWRGQQLYIPSPEKMTEAHPIAQAVGIEAARRLAHEMGGTRITVPLCIGALRADRDREIWQRYMAGDSTAAMAQDYGMQWRSIQKVTQRIRMRGGPPKREARCAEQLSFGWDQNPISRPPPKGRG